MNETVLRVHSERLEEQEKKIEALERLAELLRESLLTIAQETLINTQARGGQ